MNHKWGSNEDIHVGDIFNCWSFTSARPEYYQVVALRGRTQVVLHAIRSETYTQEGISEDSPLHYHKTRTRPLPGQFITEKEVYEIREFEVRGKWFRITGEEVTAWVEPERGPDGRPRLREVGPGGWMLGCFYDLKRPEDWDPWDLETVRRMEEAALTGEADGQP